MKIQKDIIKFKSKAQIEFIDITDQVSDLLEKSGIRNGNVCIFVRHTTMSIIINHNEPLLLQDFMHMLYRVVPAEDRYSHDLFELKKTGKLSDGRSNGHSHCKAILLGANVNVPVEDGKLLLSELQSIFAVEFDGARERDVIVQIMGV